MPLSSPVREVVATTQDSYAVQLLFVGEEDVAGAWDRRLAVGPELVEVGGVELVLLTHRLAFALAATEGGVLLLEVGGVPDLDVHADPTRDQVGATGEP